MWLFLSGWDTGEMARFRFQNGIAKSRKCTFTLEMNTRVIYLSAMVMNASSTASPLKKGHCIVFSNYISDPKLWPVVPCRENLPPYRIVPVCSGHGLEVHLDQRNKQVSGVGVHREEGQIGGGKSTASFIYWGYGKKKNDEDHCCQQNVFLPLQGTISIQAYSVIWAAWILDQEGSLNRKHRS